MAEELGKKH